MTATLIFYPNEAKKSLKTGKVPIYLRITLNGKKAETRLNAAVKVEDLSGWNSMTMRFIDRKHPVNGILNSIDKKFSDYTILNATAINNRSAAYIRDYLIGNSDKPDPLVLDYIDAFYTSAILPNIKLAYGTKYNYLKAKKHFYNFLKWQKKEGLSLNQLNSSIAIGFKDFLLGQIPEIMHAGMTEQSALGVVKKFRTIFDRAVDEDLLDKNPFKKIKLNAQSPVREKLSIHQVKQLFDFDFSKLPVQGIYRDIFLFSVFTGLAYKDAMSLTTNNLSKAGNGNTYLSLIRLKTGVQTKMVLTDHALKIIDRFKKMPDVQIKNSILPFRANDDVNLQIKVVAGLVGINIHLVTHLARHTFRSLLSEAQIADYGVIKLMMGHSRRNDIDGIYDTVTETRLIEAKRKLDLYLKQYL